MKLDELIKLEELSEETLQEIAGGTSKGEEASGCLGFSNCCNDSTTLPGKGVVGGVFY